MGRAAKLTSIDAVETLAQALRRFGEEAAAAIDDLDLEVRRAADWFQHDRRAFWAQEVRQGYDRVAEARLNLERAEMFPIAGHRPDCREEKKALERAKRRLKIAHEKVETVRRWSRTVEHAVHEYRGGVSQFALWLQAELPRALAMLKRMRTALEGYVALEAMPDAAAPSAARPEEPVEPTEPESPQGEGGTPRGDKET